MLNKGVTPYVCQKGSVGACGDLAPMSQIGIRFWSVKVKLIIKVNCLMAKLSHKAGITVPGLQARDGLATINGSNFLTAMSALLLVDANCWLKQAEIAASMSLDALKANLKPYMKEIHQVRGFKGSVRSAAAISKIIAGGDLAEGN